MAETHLPIPVTVLTGFLGSGKTTLLQAALASPELADAAVLVNELGEIGLDHHLLRRVDESTVVLASGCVCCTVRQDLADELRLLEARRHRGEIPDFRRVVIETTGLADPVPVLSTFLQDPMLEAQYAADGVVTTIDAVNAPLAAARQREWVKQVAVADRLVLTKTDLVDTPERIAERDALLTRLRALNPAAPILDAAKGEATPAALLSAGLYDPARKIPDVKTWLAAEAYAEAGHEQGHAHGHVHGHDHGHHHDPNRHDDRIRAFSLTSDKPIPGGTLEMFLELLRATHGPNLLRMKGIVNVAEMPDTPVVIHGVQHVFHPTATLPRWPDDDHRSRLVFIVRDIKPQTIRDLFEAFLGTAAIDRPDRAALTDNPLVPFGGADR